MRKKLNYWFFIVWGLTVAAIITLSVCVYGFWQYSEWITPYVVDPPIDQTQFAWVPYGFVIVGLLLFVPMFLILFEGFPQFRYEWYTAEEIEAQEKAYVRDMEEKGFNFAEDRKERLFLTEQIEKILRENPEIIVNYKSATKTEQCEKRGNP